MKQRTFSNVLKKLQSSTPELKIVKKSDSLLMKVIAVILTIVTFGATKFRKSGIMTLGKTIYVSDSWDAYPDTSKVITLCHEYVHVEQFERLGMIMFVLKYFFLPLPIVYANERKKLEREAYAETMRVSVEFYGTHILEQDNFKKSILKNFSSITYFWMWPWKKQNEKWYKSVCDEINRPQLF